VPAVCGHSSAGLAVRTHALRSRSVYFREAITIDFVKVAELSEIPAGSLKAATLDGDALVLANVDGQIFALEGTCTHRAGPLAEGKLVEGDVMCPWHGARFDVHSGEPKGRFGTVPLRTFEVQVEGNEVRVRPGN
jgi:3-phenylpropionate/trans-cinnamate dioxygenase ferredoxin subunit